ncbi:MAG TPA: hypothetical protein VFJ16_16930 [Longimicrobium sp.]|nr:hypothetical protein [Longimicrobium sp.]
MAQKGIEKQNPPDQRARGMNDEHPEGQANERNRQRQEGGAGAAPKPKPEPGG